jgi:hypothetical protein
MPRPRRPSAAFGALSLWGAGIGGARIAAASPLGLFLAPALPRPLPARPQSFGQPFSRHSWREPVPKLLPAFASSRGLWAMASPALAWAAGAKPGAAEPLAFLGSPRPAIGDNWRFQGGIPHFRYHDPERPSKTFRPEGAAPGAPRPAAPGRGRDGR